MEHIQRSVIAIAAAAQVIAPSFAAEPILLKDIVPGRSSLYEIVGTTQQHLYVQTLERNGTYAVDANGRSATKVLPFETGIAAIGPIALFGYNDLLHGDELWRSDGTKQGTYLVKDLVRGAASAHPESFTTWRGTAYFTTPPLRNQRNLPNPDDPANFDPPQLWRSDGTSAGTLPVTSLDTLVWFPDRPHVSDWGRPQALQPGPNSLYFITSAFDGVYDFESILWRSDGTPQGTVQMKHPSGDTPLYATNLLQSMGELTFFADNQDQLFGDNYDWLRGKLWRTDGSQQGSVQLSEQLAYPTLTILDGRAYFVLRIENEFILARTNEDATAVETVGMIRPESSVQEIVNISLEANSTSVFIRISSEYNDSNEAPPNELWRYSSVEQSISKVIDLSSRDNLFVFNDDHLYFVNGPRNNAELWRSDGTIVGTAPFVDLNPVGSSDPRPIQPHGDMMWFTAYDGTSRKLFRSDGTAVGTKAVLNSPALGSLPQQFVSLKSGSTLFRRELGMYAEGSGDYFTTRGTPSTTSLLESSQGKITCSNCDSAPLPIGNGALILSPGTLWFTDGSNSANSTRVVKTDLWPDFSLAKSSLNKKALSLLNQTTALFFTLERSPDWDQWENRTYIRKLWQTNGGPAGTKLVKSFSFADDLESVSVATAEGLTAHRGLAYFVADDGVHGNELWRTNGSVDGTYMVKDVVAGVADASIQNITAARQWVYFTYSDPSGVHLARTRGSANDTLRIATFPSDAGIAAKFVAINDDIFFALGRDLYRSNGQPGNLRRLGRFAYSSLPGHSGSEIAGVSTDWPTAMTVHRNQLYFVAPASIDGPLRVWRADGKKAKAEIVTPQFDVRAYGADDVGLTAHGDRLFLSVVDRVGQRGGIFELRTRGNRNQWVRHSNMSARELRVASDKMYFAGIDDQYGEEPRVLPLPKRP